MTHIFVLTLFTSFLFSISLQKSFSIAIHNSYEIKAIEKDIEAIQEEIEVAMSWSNPLLSFSLNDISLKRPIKRDLEAMQTNTLGISQKIPLGDNLKIKQNVLEIKQKILKEKKEHLKNILKSKIYTTAYKIEILEKKLIIIKKLQQNMNNMKKAATFLYNSGKLKQGKIIEMDLELSKFKIQKNNLQLKLISAKSLFTSLLNISYSKVSVSLDLKNINFNENEIANNFPKIKALKLAQKLMLTKKRLELSKKNEFINTKLSYSYRDNFNDFISLSFSMPLAFTNVEKHKANKFGILSAKETINLEEEMFSTKLTLELITGQNELLKSNYNIIIYELLKSTEKLTGLYKTHLESRMMDRLSLYKNETKRLQYKMQEYDTLQKYFNNLSKLITYGVKL